MPALTKTDRWVLVGILCFAALVHFGRIGASINGVHLTTDPAMYASISAAYGHPEAFAEDFVYSNPAMFSTHITPLVQLTHFLVGADGNYGLAYLQLTGLSVFLHYAAFYLLGIVLFSQRWKALVFTTLMGLSYWVPWGTYWGAGYLDYTPRSLFNALYALYLCIGLALLRRPRWWPLFMVATGLLVYIHSISALAAVAGLWLSFAASRPEGVSWPRHLLWMFFCGCCFLATLLPYAAVYLHSSGISLGKDDIAFMRHILRTRFDIEYAEYWYGMKKFLKQYTLLPVLPLAGWGTWMIWKYGTPREKLLGKHIWLWIAGTCVVIALFILDQQIARIWERHHFEFDLIRVHRFFPFFAICLIFLGGNILLRKFSEPGWKRNAARVFYAGLVIGFFCGGQQDMARVSFEWYWNRLDPARYEAAYGPQLRRLEMVEALKSRTKPGETIFYPGEDQAIRYISLRPLTYGWKDACLMYYAKALPELRLWSHMETALDASPTAYIAEGLATSPDYLLSERPQDRNLLETLVGPVIWENSRYVLVKNMHKKSADTSPRRPPASSGP